MADFFGEDFLLDDETAKTLYHEYACRMPVIDYHCHIDAADIYSDRRFTDLSEAWLGGDHYKWRLMRACGVREELITGSAAGFDKFKAFAEILPAAVSNPVYHWAHLELQRFFGIKKPLGPDTAGEIWEQTREILSTDKSLSTRGILGRMNVEAIITTDDPAGNLEQHRLLAEDSGSTGTACMCKVLPCFRPDAAFNIEREGFRQYIGKLGDSAGLAINHYDDLKQALGRRIDYFGKNGCRAADHGIFKLEYAPAADKEINEIFVSALNGAAVSIQDACKYRYALLMMLAGEYSRLDWVMELHLGVLRNVNSGMFDRLGPDTGFDSIGPSVDIRHLAEVLNGLDKRRMLPKTLIYSLNPNDNAAINAIAGCFCSEEVKGKVQQGSAWWFNDSLSGIKHQLLCFAQCGVLGSFLGMLTDSRSFFSYPRHEYFRRILCAFLGRHAQAGLYPDDIDMLGKIVRDISYYNVKEYFRL